MMRLLVVLALLILAGQIGCTPRTIVRKNPIASDQGVRYYRPKPYLLVTPVEQIVAGQKDTSQPGPNFVQIQLQYLPDFSEEYSITVKSGLGTNNTSITLEDGWNLTAIGQDLDSQFDENVRAVADLVDTAGSLVAAAGVAKANGGTAEATVASSNVPIGYYESVIGRDSRGCKQLFGWRYIGFAPIQGCPLITHGSECQTCETLPLFGLVFRDGKMVFVPLEEVPYYVEPADVDSAAASGRP